MILAGSITQSRNRKRHAPTDEGQPVCRVVSSLPEGSLLRGDCHECLGALGARAPRFGGKAQGRKWQWQADAIKHSFFPGHWGPEENKQRCHCCCWWLPRVTGWLHRCWLGTRRRTSRPPIRESHFCSWWEEEGFRWGALSQRPSTRL